MTIFRAWILIVAIWGVVGNAHTVITYPGWRGNNLKTTDEEPYGMQWRYPCGGIPVTTNRTNWPTTGGAIAVQPGWFRGHSSAFIYINLGIGSDGPDGGPQNMSFPMVPVFQIIGPTNNPYPGTFCLPQVSLPENVTVNVGDHATIQVIEAARHGAGIYNCVDIIFTDPEDAPEVNASNCFNSTTIQFKDPFADDCSSTTAEPESTGSTGFGHHTATDTDDCENGYYDSYYYGCKTATAAASTVTVTATSSCPPAVCPTGNGIVRAKDGLGIGSALGVLALGLLGV